MAVTYNPAELDYSASGDRQQRINAVRFLLRDRPRDRVTPLFEDEELGTWIDQWHSVWTAAAELADMIVGGGIIGDRVGSAQVQYLRTMAPTWRNRGRSHQTPRLGQRGPGFFVTEGQR